MRFVVALSLIASANAGCRGDEAPQVFIEEEPEVRDHGISRALVDGVSLDALTRTDAVPYESRMTSSYDRSSVVRNGSGWFANRDWDGRVASSTEDGQLLFDEVGPGVVTRIWSANPNGLVRFFFDDETTPRWEVDLADLLAGRTSIAGGNLTGGVPGSPTLLWPIPFSRRLRITSTGQSFYYQVDYRRYAEGTDVGVAQPSSEFEGDELPFYLSRVGGKRAKPLASRTVEQRLVAGSGDVLAIAADDGGSEVIEMSATLDFANEDALEQTILRIDIDGARTVFVPIARFFLFDPAGAEAHSLPIDSVPESRVVVSRFRMPFASEAELELVAPQGTAVAADFRVDLRSRAVDDDDLRFHASWTGPMVVDSGTPIDLGFIRIVGRGRYVGTSLRIGSTTRSGWWGEGDEKIWIDDSSFPARFGTGTEDYYGYSFCSSALFSTAFVGQFRANRYDYAGIIELYRFHFADAMSFDSSFEFVQEVRHWDADFGVHTPIDVDGVSYFYGARGAKIEGPWDEAVPHAKMRVPAEALISTGTEVASCR